MFQNLVVLFALLAFASSRDRYGRWGERRARREAVVVPGSTDFPESMSASSDGTLYFSSFAGAPGLAGEAGRDSRQANSSRQGSNGLSSALGVLADDKSNTLFVCSDDFSAAGLEYSRRTATALKLFDLKTGEPKGSVPAPGYRRPLCNDIVVGSDGTAYVSDSFAAQILRLKPGAKEFEVWASDPRWDVPGKARAGRHRRSC